MKTLKSLFLLLLITLATPLTAQTADEIIANYFENTGGIENWRSITGLKIEGSIIFQGMEQRTEMVQLADGRSLAKADSQGQTFYQYVYDGTTLWGTNLMTMAVEKADAEATANYKNDLNDFPDPFLDYASKGHKVELVGTETIEGTRTYKIKLTKEPFMTDGVELQDVTFYYFDSENFVPILFEKVIKESSMAGRIGQTKIDDYQEVNGLYFPFSFTEGIKGLSVGQQFIIKNILLNPEVNQSLFTFHEPSSTTPTGKQ